MLQVDGKCANLAVFFFVSQDGSLVLSVSRHRTVCSMRKRKSFCLGFETLAGRKEQEETSPGGKVENEGSFVGSRPPKSRRIRPTESVQASEAVGCQLDLRTGDTGEIRRWFAPSRIPKERVETQNRQNLIPRADTTPRLLCL